MDLGELPGASMEKPLIEIASDCSMAVESHFDDDILVNNLSEVSKTSLISKECWHLIGSFLGFVDLCKLPLLSTHIKSFFDEDFFWQHYVVSHLLPQGCDAVEGQSVAPSKTEIRLELTLVEQPLSLFAKIWEHLNSGRVYNVAKKISAVSSLDREEESPENVLKLSSCFYFMKSPNRNQQLLPYQQMLYEGYRIQRQCGCAGGRPCYWSSRPSTTQRSFEYLNIHLSTSVACLTGFSLTPYQAFFHPNAPVYGPLEVAIQILAPNRVTESVSSEGNEPKCRSNGYVSEGTTESDAADRTYRIEQLDHAQTLRDVYFESHFFTVSNSFEKQIFFLPEPVLCVGGEVRIVFRGMQTRQTLGFHLFPEDFYLCISNVGVLAVPFEGYFISDTGDDDSRVIVNPCSPGKELQQSQYATNYGNQSSTLKLSLCRTPTMLLDMNTVRRDRQEDHGATVCSPFVQTHQSIINEDNDAQSRNGSTLYSFFRNSRLSSTDSDLQYSSANSCSLC